MSEPRGGRVLVLGGYGAVGRHTARALAERLPGKVVVAGRDGGRAARLAADSGGALLAARVDLGDPASLRRALEGVSLVILAVEPRTPEEHPAGLLFDHGVDLVDVTATHRMVAEVEGHDGRARARGAAAVLSVGVAPGLTNLLARRVHDDLGGADRIDLSVLLGTGEAHGRDAVRWTVGRLADVGAGPDRPLRIGMGPVRGPRTLHPFPFSDQYTLRRTLGVPRVTTRLGLDSGPLTGLLFGLRRAGAFAAARSAGLEDALVAGFGRFHTGGEEFVVRADAHHRGRHAARALTASSQSRFTGLVAAEVAARVYGGGLPAGVHHIEESDVFADLPEVLAKGGLRSWTVAAGAPARTAPAG
ncbi:saccharopine dehydrogenase NADP-binding domain-containing protein [Streptomyces sp. URMC 123]|uniref:saccharopine dehydrogenase NADP-binding domain-containing protein n=1 Tax=Streptomyces sp. URMC 123 TaxID=3423403 RepID=UPI003F1AC10D